MGEDCCAETNWADNANSATNHNLLKVEIARRSQLASGNTEGIDLRIELEFKLSQKGRTYKGLEAAIGIKPMNKGFADRVKPLSTMCYRVISSAIYRLSRLTAVKHITQYHVILGTKVGTP